jgi:hypothetical protein
MSVALIIRVAMRMHRIILSSVACLAVLGNAQSGVISGDGQQKQKLLSERTIGKLCFEGTIPTNHITNM